jgi:hypothetical protein
LGGLQYADLSELIWSVFSKKYKSKHKLQSWPMQYFMVTVKLLLTDYLPKFGISDNTAIKQMVIKCIKASQLVPDSSKIK